jgi:hypothetical protein
VVGPAEDGAASSIPLDLKEAGGRRHFPGLLQETAAAHFPSNGDGKRDGAILLETGVGGLSRCSDAGGPRTGGERIGAAKSQRYEGGNHRLLGRYLDL